MRTAIYCILEILVITAVTLNLPSCKKYLDAKPNSKLLIPSSTGDLMQLLDRDDFISFFSSGAGDFCSENIYYTDDIWALLSDASKYGYVWDSRMFSGMSNSRDWQLIYNAAYYANVVLDELNNIPKTSSNTSDWDYCNGAALVFRAKAFYEVAQIWTKAYDSSTAATDLGIPLRLDPDFNKPTTRATLKETYERIVHDLEEAIPLLPVSQVHPFRPTKPAAYGYLARTYLAARDYTRAGLYADSCLQLRNALLDYNDIDASADFPFQSIVYKNPEDIMYSGKGGSTIDEGTLIYYANIDTLFLKSYDDNDLRKSVFFKPKGDGNYYFDGTYGYYSGYGNIYNGITTAEMFLIKAESKARQGKNNEAIELLNKLREKRWRRGTFIPYTSNDPESTLSTILEERHKELILRSVRLTDLKRLNKEGRNIVLTRTFNGQTYTLPPNDPRYALPIPDLVIQVTGIEQN